MKKEIPELYKVKEVTDTIQHLIDLRGKTSYVQRRLIEMLQRISGAQEVSFSVTEDYKLDKIYHSDLLTEEESKVLSHENTFMRDKFIEFNRQKFVDEFGT